MSSIGKDDNLPSDAVLLGSVPMYYSNTSPGYVWVTFLGCLVRMKLGGESGPTSERVESVRFWSSDGRGRYAPQSGACIDLGLIDPQLKKLLLVNKIIEIVFTQPPTGESLHVDLRVHGNAP
jgi:hypothetical protein